MVGIISSNPVVCECRGILDGDFAAKRKIGGIGSLNRLFLRQFVWF